MSETDPIFSIPDEPDKPERKEIGDSSEPVFQHGQFKLLSDEEIKALEPKPAPPAPVIMDSTEVAAPDPNPAPTPPKQEQEYTGPSFFAPQDNSVHPLKLRAGQFIQSSEDKPDTLIKTPAKPAPKQTVPEAPAPRRRQVPQGHIEPEPRPGFWGNAVVRIVGFFVLFFVIAVIIALPTKLEATYLSEHQRLNTYLGFADEMAAALIAFWVMVRFNEHKSLVDAGWSKQDAFWQALKGFGLGALCVALTFVALLIAYVYTPGEVNQDAALLAPLIVCVMIAVSDETIFRGFILRVVEERFGSLAGIVVSCAFFTVLHYLESNPSVTDYQKILGPVIIGFGEGLAFAAAFVATRNLWMPIGIHLAVLFLMGPVLGFNSANAADAGNSLMHGFCQGDFWQTGGNYYPDASVPAGFMFAVAGVLLIMKAKKNGNWRMPKRRI